MKTKTIAFLVMAAVVMSVAAMGAVMAGEKGCATIQDGTICASTGELLTTGYDTFGYNYQAHQYIGYYGNYQRPPEPVNWGYRLMMKWNDAWLSNMDCDGDNLLDRHYGYDSYRGSGAWLTNHQSGTSINDAGEECNWNYFVKIVAVPVDATLTEGMWYNTADGTEIGPVIWGSFAIIAEVENDPCAGLHGSQYQSPTSPGFGGYIP